MNFSIENYNPEAIFADEKIEFNNNFPRVSVDLIIKPDEMRFQTEPLEVNINTKIGTISLMDLLENLQNATGMSIINEFEVSYYNPVTEMYTKVANINKYAFIPSHVIYQGEGCDYITVRLNRIVKAKSDAAFHQIDMSQLSTEVEAEEENYGELKRKMRAKEKTIAEAIDLVRQWRILYSGATDINTGETVRLSLEEGAKRLKCAKKSLDDYLLMIKHAKSHNFNFETHKNEGFGYLRAFVKRAKLDQTEEDDADDKSVPKRKASKKINGKRN